MTQPQQRWSLVGMALITGLVACGGVVQFAGNTPAIAGNPPAPPPAPAPTPPPAVVAPKVFKRVEVTAERIVINEKIQFDSNKATIKAESNGLLDEIAKTIKEAPQLKKLEIQGHASSEGDAKANLKLSDDRAKSVMAALVSRQVKADVLTAKGYGSEKKLVEEKTEADREKNRRVEFLILDPAPKPGAAATPTPAPTAAPTGTTTAVSGSKPAGSAPAIAPTAPKTTPKAGTLTPAPKK